MDGLARALPESAAYAGLVCFVDPIDGTREFCTGKGEQCSICIGFAEIASGMALAGLVYRPLCPQKSWALGCAKEGVSKSAPPPARDSLDGGAFLASNSGTSAFLNAVRAEMGCSLRPQGGAGNKALVRARATPARIIKLLACQRRSLTHPVFRARSRAVTVRA